MGNTQHPTTTYSYPIAGSKEDGYSQIYRDPNYMGALVTKYEDFESIGDVWRKNFSEYPSSNVLGWRQKSGATKSAGSFVNALMEDHWNWMNFSEIEKKCRQIATGINKQGLAPELREYKDLSLRLVGTMSVNNKSLILLDACCATYGITSVPLYDTLGVEAVKHMFSETNMTTAFVDMASAQRLVEFANTGSCPTLKNLVVIDDEEYDTNFQNRYNYRKNWRSSNKGAEVLVRGESDSIPQTAPKDPSGDQINKIKTSDKNNQLKITKISEFWKIDSDKVDPYNMSVTGDDVYTFSYTSGTTSAPKGAMLSHKNILSMFKSIESLAKPEGEVRYVSYLPLAHVYERINMNFVISARGKYAIFNGVAARVTEDLQSIKPTLFASVPRFFNTVHAKVWGTCNKLQGVGQTLFKKGYAVKEAKLQSSGQPTHAFWDALVFNKMKKNLGGCVEVMITASAPIKGEVLNDLKIFFCCPVIEAYGQTEGCGGEFCSARFDSKIGHVGGPLAQNEYRLKDVPEMNYYSTDVDALGRAQPRGEVCVRGANVIQGYYKQPEKTAETITEDGWLISGDIGMILPESNALKIVDRKKNIFKLAFGEYVAPEKLENSIKILPEIEDVFITGNSTQDYVVGIVCVEEHAAKEISDRLKLTGSYEKICENKDFHNEVATIIKNQHIKEKHMKYEYLNKFYIFPKLFTEVDGLTTTTFKQKRNVAEELFKSQINQMYGN